MTNTDLFTSHRTPGWQGLGTVFTEEVTDYRRMLELAGLDNWNVRMEDVTIPTSPDAKWEVSANAVVADLHDGPRVLGITGSRYEIVQNEQAFEFLQSLHDGARWETAGAFRGGRIVFGTLAFDHDFVLDPTGVADVVKSYLLVNTSHDGSTGIAGGVTPVRVICQNTLNVAMKNIKQTFKIRHTMGAEERMRVEAEVWRQANTYMDSFQQEAQTLFQTAATDKQYFEIVEGFYPKPEKDVKGSLKKWETQMEKFTQAWKGAPNAGIKNTAWGVFNGLTEANQWGRNVRNTENGKENFFAAGAGFDIPTNVFRQEALRAAQSLV